MTESDDARQRIDERDRLRKEAAERGRLLPADYRENIRRQFERGAAEARFIVSEHIMFPAAKEPMMPESRTGLAQHIDPDDEGWQARALLAFHQIPLGHAESDDLEFARHALSELLSFPPEQPKDSA